MFGWFRKWPHTSEMIDKQLKNESVKKEDAEFCGENLIVRKLNVCFIHWPSVDEHVLVLKVEF